MGANDIGQAAGHLIKIGGGLAAIGIVLAGWLAFTEWPIRDCVGAMETCADYQKVYDGAQILTNLFVALVGGAFGAAVGLGLVRSGLFSANTLGMDDEHD